ncbi:MAG: hypothetical protein WBV81_00235, partial [Ignavibacteriaceae bacterium]
IIILKAARPILPKPLIATLTIIDLLSKNRFLFCSIIYCSKTSLFFYLNKKPNCITSLYS